MQAVRALYTPKDGDSSSDDDVVREAIERRHSNRKARVFRQTRLRGFNSERAQKMVCVVILKYHNFLTFKKTSVRKSMNELLGIKKDDDIYHYESATAEEVNSYDAGTGDAPELQPMRLYLETKQCVTWNDELCELFLDHYEQEFGNRPAAHTESKIRSGGVFRESSSPTWLQVEGVPCEWREHSHGKEGSTKE